MRFTAASVALFAGTALAIPGYQNGYPVDPQPSTVYSTKDVTITSCPPGGYDCPGTVHPEPTGGYPVPSDVDPEPTGYPSETPVYPTGVDPTGGESSVYPTEPEPTGYPSETPSASPTDEPPTGYPTDGESSVYPTGEPTDVYPTDGESSVYPTGPQPTTSTITYTTCIPTVTSSITVIYPNEPAPTEPVPTYPSGSDGLPHPTGGYPTNPTPPPYDEGAASSVGVNFAVAGIAAVAALFLA
ncbi:hypothetical protein RJ035_004340 [Blastomyces gilchristii]